MEPINIIIYILGFISALALAFFSHIFMKIRDSKKEFINAALEFRKPFIEAKTILDVNTKGLHDEYNISDVFASLYSNQKRSISKFEPFLPEKFKIGIRSSWQDYETYINQEDIASWFTSNQHFKTSEDITNKRIYLIKKIDNILSYSDYNNIYSVYRFIKKT